MVSISRRLGVQATGPAEEMWKESLEGSQGEMFLHNNWLELAAVTSHRKPAQSGTRQRLLFSEEPEKLLLLFFLFFGHGENTARS